MTRADTYPTTPSTPLVRRVLRTLAGAWAGGILANVICAILSASHTTQLVVSLAMLVIGAAVGWAESRDAGPWPADDLRDGVIGWGIIAAITLGSIAVFALVAAV